MASDTTNATDPKMIEALFVQTAAGMSFDEGVLTLFGLTPTALMFSDRPDRVTGHILSSDFVDSWDQGEDSFASNPPNAVLSIFQSDHVQDVVVVLTSPEYDGVNLSYGVDILDGDMPATGGEVALFIDVIGRPLSPVSVAGMHRRDRRAGRRMGR